MLSAIALFATANTGFLHPAHGSAPDSDLWMGRDPVTPFIFSALLFWA